MLGISDDLWVKILTVASVLSAAGFGMLGLFTDYKREGKITAFGRLAVGGIALSAALSILLGVLRDKIDAVAAAAAAARAEHERKVEQKRFAEQTNRLMGLADQMALSLGQQKQQLDRQQAQHVLQQALVARSASLMRLTSTLRDEQGADTLRMLRRMWSDANWVSPDRISVTVMFLCQVAPGRNLPSFASDDWSAGLEILADAPTDEATALIHSTRYASFAPRSLDPVSAMQLVTFSPFESLESATVERIGPVEFWRDRDVSLQMIGSNPELARRVYQAADEMLPPARPASDFEGLSGEIYDGRNAVPIETCTTQMSLKVNFRIVAESFGKIYEVLPDEAAPEDDGRAGFVSVVFQPADVLPQALPSFTN